jgi:hypothetical protein
MLLERHDGHKVYILWRTAKKPEYLCQSGRPLLDNGYASRSGFIGNAFKSTHQPTSEYWNHIGGSFPRQRVSTDKFPAQQIGRFMTTNYPTRCHTSNKYMATGPTGARCQE